MAAGSQATRDAGSQATREAMAWVLMAWVLMAWVLMAWVLEAANPAQPGHSWRVSGYAAPLLVLPVVIRFLIGRDYGLEESARVFDGLPWL